MNFKQIISMLLLVTLWLFGARYLDLQKENISNDRYTIIHAGKTDLTNTPLNILLDKKTGKTWVNMGHLSKDVMGIVLWLPMEFKKPLDNSANNYPSQ